MPAGKKAIPVEIKASWEFLAAVYPEVQSGKSSEDIRYSYRKQFPFVLPWRLSEHSLLTDLTNPGFSFLFLSPSSTHSLRANQPPSSPTDTSTAWKREFSFKISSFQTLVQTHRYHRACKSQCQGTSPEWCCQWRREGSFPISAGSCGDLMGVRTFCSHWR